METYYVVLERSVSGEVLCQVFTPSPNLDDAVGSGQMVRWEFDFPLGSGRIWHVYVYQRASLGIPAGTELEAINQRVVECVFGAVGV